MVWLVKYCTIWTCTYTCRRAMCVAYCVVMRFSLVWYRKLRVELVLEVDVSLEFIKTVHIISKTPLTDVVMLEVFLVLRVHSKYLNTLSFCRFQKKFSRVICVSVNKTECNRKRQTNSRQNSPSVDLCRNRESDNASHTYNDAHYRQYVGDIKCTWRDA